MIKSMTAFAGAEDADGGITTTVEIRGYNSRYLDLSVRLPATYASLEDYVKQRVSNAISRGRVEVRVGISRQETQTSSFTVNKQLAEAYYNALNQLRDHLCLDEPVSLSQLAGVIGVVESVEPSADMEDVRQSLGRSLERALADFDAMRTNEGRAMAEELYNRLGFIENCLQRIDHLRQGLLAYYQQRLKSRIRELTRDTGEIDQSRIAQEAALLADKSDISEEVTRVQSHAKQFRQIMADDEPGGKPLNFLLQEFAREFNTMGAKAASADISHLVVSAKTELEKLREQVQNIE
ncbi:MAG: YicC/YloC family endoribonuclease [Desulfobacterales bacterium]